MSFDDLIFLAKGLVKGWNKGKLEKKIQETAIEALDNRIKVAELEDKVSDLENEIRRLKGEKPKSAFTPTSSTYFNPTPKKKHDH